LTLEDLDALEPGAVLPIPDNAIRHIDLAIGQANQRSVIGHGKLGAFEGSKVVKLSEDLDAEVTEHLRRSIGPRP
ncbi:MAG: hypothetical protein AAFQ51_15180, partial [Pseudomonadota bacterium]